MKTPIAIWISAFVLTYSFIDIANGQSCSCPGQRLNVGKHDSCFQIERNAGGSWTAADKKCSSMGGFVAHIDSPDLLNSLKSYIQENYQQKLMTGGLVGNAEYQLIAMMCPNNSFLGILNTTIASDIINANTSAASGSCLFLENSDYKLHYGNCNVSSDVLCEMPMTSSETCGVSMQCGSSPMSNLLTTQTSNVVAASPSGNSGSSSGSAANPPPQSNSGVSSGSAFNSTSPPFLNFISTSSANQNGNFGSTSVSNPANSPQNSNVPMSSNRPSSAIPLGGQNSSSSSMPTRTPNAIASNSQTYSFPTVPSNSTATYTPDNSSNSTSDQCDSGYTKLGSWCLPWWAWLVFGVLAFLAIFAFVMCLVFMWAGNRKKKVYVIDNTRRSNGSDFNRSDLSRQKLTANSTRPQLYDVKAYNSTPNDLMAPVPHEAISNPSMPFANERAVTGAVGNSVYV
ncbi:hypothetical protein M3Y94_00453600 [Aphelenchoides besseyi]|nr:hypothetical protein M3Y94_00453600 [Aphelenchoides besseyi]KAI6229283.1 hypothetical protein M3Y95_00514700 [Aphelenchoides besseyi]